MTNVTPDKQATHEALEQLARGAVIKRCPPKVAEGAATVIKPRDITRRAKLAALATQPS